MVAQPLEVAANAGHDTGHSPDPRSVCLAERIDDARPDTRLVLAGVVEQAGDEDIGLVHALSPERRDDVEPVAPIGDVHRVEEREL